MCNLQFLYFAHHIMVIYICIKFQENIFNSFQVTEWTQIYYRNHYVQSSKGHNSKSRFIRVTVLGFCTLSHHVLHLCEVSSKYLEWFSTYRAGMIHSRIYYIQKATTPKIGKPELRIFCSARCLMVFNICEKFHYSIEQT